MKNILLRAGVLCLCFIGYSLNLFAQKEVIQDEITYMCAGDSAILTKCQIVYPSIISVPGIIKSAGKEYKVTAIGEWAFRSSRVQGVDLSGCLSLKIIRKYAFSYLLSLSDIILPSSVEVIEKNAFSYGGLESINLFDCNRLTYIGEHAFDGAFLKSITLPRSLTYVGEYAFSYNYTLAEVDMFDCEFLDTIKELTFYNCSRLNSVILPQNLKCIEALAFNDCKELVSIDIPSTVSNIEEMAFSGCVKLQYVNIQEGNPNFIFSDGLVLSKDKKTVILCVGSKNGEFVLPDGVEKIEKSAFYYCTGLTSMDFSKCNSLISIEDNALGACFNMEKVSFPKNLSNIGKGILFQCESLSAIDVHNDNEYYTVLDGILYTKDFKRLFACPAKREAPVEINKNVEAIEVSAFMGCNLITELDFSGCNSLIIIKDFACSEMKNLKKLKFPPALLTICQSAFYSCISIDELDFPASLSTIESRAFNSCQKLYAITYRGDIEPGIGDDAFYTRYTIERTLYLPNAISGFDASKWGGIVNIKYGDQPGAIEMNAEDSNVIYGGKGIVSIDSSNQVPYSIVSLNGYEVAGGVLTFGENKITVNAPGIYIVKAGNKVNKVIVK